MFDIMKPYFIALPSRNFIPKAIALNISYCERPIGFDISF